MNKKIKKILATVSAMAMCATSVVSMGAGAIAVFKDRVVRPETTSFYIKSYDNTNVKVHLWQKATDYFDNEDVKIYISDIFVNDFGKEYTHKLISNHVHYYDTIAEKWIDHCSVAVFGGFGSFIFDNSEDFTSFEKYLSDNNIAYKIYDDDSENVICLDYADDDELFDILQKIKDDTGIETVVENPATTIQITETENTLPEPTLSGDANNDGKVSMADAVLIMQALSNPDEYKITPQGMANADIDGDGLTPTDAVKIQEIVLNS